MVVVCTPDAVVTGGEVMVGVVDEVVLETAPVLSGSSYSDRRSPNSRFVREILPANTVPKQSAACATANACLNVMMTIMIPKSSISAK